MAAKAIIIATKLDGTQSVVGEVMPLSKAKDALRAFKGEGLKKVELFDLRQHVKRRKLNRKALAVELPTFDEIAEKLAADPALIPEKGYGKSGAPNVGPLNEAFGVKVDGKARDEIWAKVQEIQSAATDDDPPEE